MMRETPSHQDTPCDPIRITGACVIVHAYRTPAGRYRFASWQLDLALLPATNGALVDVPLELPSDEFTATTFDSTYHLATAAERELRRLYN